MSVAKKRPAAGSGRASLEVCCENEHTRDDANTQIVPSRIRRIRRQNRRPKWTLGYVFRQRGQVYEVVGFAPYTTRYGLDIELLELAGWCAVCGRLFFSTASKKRCRAGRKGKGLLRTCEAHRGDFHGNRRPTAAKLADAPEPRPKSKAAKPVAAQPKPKPIIVPPPTWYPSSEARAHIDLVHSLAAGANGVVFWRSHGQVPRSRCRLLSAQGVAGADDVSATIAGMAHHIRVEHRNIGMALSTMHRAPIAWAERRRCVAAVLALGTEVADLAAPPFRPSYVLEVAPGRHTAFYVLERPATPGAAQPVADALARFTGCIASADLTHPWSIPGLARWPSRAEVDAGWPNEVFPARVARPYTGERVSLAEFAAWLRVMS
jgi:hypothetical protein